MAIVRSFRQVVLSSVHRAVGLHCNKFCNKKGNNLELKGQRGDVWIGKKSIRYLCKMGPLQNPLAYWLVYTHSLMHLFTHAQINKSHNISRNLFNGISSQRKLNYLKFIRFFFLLNTQFELFFWFQTKNGTWEKWQQKRRSDSVSIQRKTKRSILNTSSQLRIYSHFWVVVMIWHNESRCQLEMSILIELKGRSMIITCIQAISLDPNVFVVVVVIIIIVAARLFRVSKIPFLFHRFP